jgi:hypothetical protein
MPETTHSCPGGCGQHVAHHRYACPNCWARLPKALRNGITANYGRNLAAHGSAMAAARRWYRDNPIHERPKGAHEQVSRQFEQALPGGGGTWSTLAEDLLDPSGAVTHPHTPEETPDA